MKKLRLVALAIGAIATLASAPAMARSVHHQAMQDQRPLYMQVPASQAAGSGYEAAPFAPYPNPVPHTGTQENRAEWDPGYVPTAPE